eukprot:scaffold2040_cov89-Skeletonema_dohrnii-CCMP3373.AAC.2
MLHHNYFRHLPGFYLQPCVWHPSTLLVVSSYCHSGIATSSSESEVQKCMCHLGTVLGTSLIPKKGFCNGKWYLIKGINNNLLRLASCTFQCNAMIRNQASLSFEDIIQYCWRITLRLTDHKVRLLTSLESSNKCVHAWSRVLWIYGRTVDPKGGLHIYANQVEFDNMQGQGHLTL